MIRTLLLVVLCVSFAHGQSTKFLIGSRDSGAVTVDNNPPAAPGNLQVVAYGEDSIRFSWTAPGDDGMVGTATSYTIGHSTTPITGGELIPNTTMATNISGWTVLAGSESISWSSFGYNTPGSLKLVASGASYEGVLAPVNTTVSGSVYVSAWVYYSGPNASTTRDFYVLDQNNGVVGSFESSTLYRGAWTYLSRTVQANGSQTQLRLGIQFDPGVAGDTLYVDDVSMTTGVSYASTQKVGDAPTPAASGTTQYYTLTGLSEGVTYFLGVQAVDDKGNLSPVSAILQQATRTTVTPPTGGEDTVYYVSTGYYVTPTGSAGNTGKSLASPWSLAKALATVGSELGTSYDSVLVEPGVYDNTVSLTYAGLSSMPIVWKKRGVGTVTIRGGPTDYAIAAFDKAYHTFDGFTFTCQDTNAGPIYEVQSSYFMGAITASHVTIKRCRFISGINDIEKHNQNIGNDGERRYRGLEIGYGDVPVQYARIERCYFENFNIGIHVHSYAPRYHTIRGDTVLNSYQSSINLQGYHSRTTAPSDPNTYMHGVLIDSCYLAGSLIEDNLQWEDWADEYDSGGNLVSYNVGKTFSNKGYIAKDNVLLRTAEQAIDMKTASYIVLEGNIIQGSEGDDDGLHYSNANDRGSGGAVEILNQQPGTDHITVRYNVIYDNLYAGTTTSQENIFNNTILNNRRDYTGPNSTAYASHGFAPYGALAGPNEQFNNIMAGQGTANSSVLYVLYEGGPVTSDYNLFWDSTGSSRWSSDLWIGYSQRTDYTSLAAWQNAGWNWDQNSRYANPQFENTPIHVWGYNPAYTFRVASTSAAVNAGRAHSYAVGSGTNSTTLTPANVGIFRANFGNPDILGDLIQIGNTIPVRVTYINYNNGTLTLESARSWASSDPIILRDYVTDGIPDIGAKER